jgi:hypothetical protein
MLSENTVGGLDMFHYRVTEKDGETVYEIRNPSCFPIRTEKTESEAMRICNYLNGGLGIALEDIHHLLQLIHRKLR